VTTRLRLTDGFSKKWENHELMFAPHWAGTILPPAHDAQDDARCCRWALDDGAAFERIGESDSMKSLS
jgi:hypothetical protein